MVYAKIFQRFKDFGQIKKWKNETAIYVITAVDIIPVGHGFLRFLSPISTDFPKIF